MMSLAVTLGFSVAAAGCGDYADGDGTVEAGEATDEALLWLDESAPDDEELAAGEASELGTAEQELFFFSNPFNFASSCSDSKGTNSVMAALAVATATELKRWQPTKDFVSSGGVLKLTSTGKAQCADGRCWNTQAILDLQFAPAGSVEVRPGVKLDSAALKSALTRNLLLQVFSLLSMVVPAHKFELVRSEPGGCDQFYWFNTTTPQGDKVSGFLLSTLEQKLTWVGGSGNPYIQFDTNGSMVGIDPTYGLNQAGTTGTGSCTAACTKMSSTNIAGQCCTCNGTKTFQRSPWSATTFVCR